LLAGAIALGLRLPALLTAAKLEEEVLRTVQKNGLARLARVRLQVYAGGSGLFSHENQAANYLVECFPLFPEIIAFNENGLVLGIATGLAKSPDSLAGFKTCSALIYAMAAKQALAARWNDALVCNTHGRIIESAIANVFWVKDGTIFTPPLSEGCVAGVMRRHICENQPVIERPLTIEELHSASEVLLTNAIRRIKWVASIGQSRYSSYMAAKISSELF